MIDLDAIKARVAAATKAMTSWTPSQTPGYVAQGAHLGETLISLDDTYENSNEDCAFIAAARTDVPALVAEVEHLDALHTSACLRMSEMAEEFGRVEAERDAARAEVERLRAQLAERLENPRLCRLWSERDARCGTCEPCQLDAERTRLGKALDNAMRRMKRARAKTLFDGYDRAETNAILAEAIEQARAALGDAP